MVSFKRQVADILDKLPDDCTAEDIQYTLYVNEVIRRRLESAEKSRPVPRAEAEQQLSKWLLK
jgi:hypothetical protein